MPDQVLQDIKDRLNIVDVLSGYIQLKKAGTSYKALCPFHSEKTPSLNVSPQKQIWHCFGCGVGGDIFGFVMQYENVDFKEALKILAQKAGVELPKFRAQDPKEQEEKELLFRINDFAARLYHQALLKNKIASEYLKNRGLTPGTIEQWQIGFAPEDFHFLHHSLLKKNIKEDQAVKAGVLARGEKNNIYDRFRGRITFPIFNYFGEIIGFSARILPELDDLPAGRQAAQTAKYINSPETAIYNKSQVLFGLNFAKDDIRKQDEMVVVEGQMDTVSLHQAGFKNVIASSGTAYNEKTMAFTMARRLTRNIKLCFDSDAAGQMALKKAGQMLLQAGFRIKIIILKAVKDPDELVKKSPGLWKKAVTEAVWFLDFYINSAKEKFPNDPVEQKHYLTEEVIPFLGYITEPLEQDHYIFELVKKYGISEKVIRQQISHKGKKSENILPSALVPRPKVSLLEKEVLGGLLFSSEFLEKVKDSLNEEDFEDLEIRQAISGLINSGQINQAVRESALAKEAVFMVEFAGEEQDKGLFLKKLLKSYSLLKVGSLKKKQKFLQNEMARAESSRDTKKASELNQEFARVSKLKMEWESK